MLSLLKKNPDTSSGNSLNRPWHPNFRDAATLPDTKVIRTSFFINTVFGLVAAALGFMFVSQEYAIRDLHSQIRLLEEQILKDSKPSNAAGALYAQFQVEEKKIKEVETFLSANKITVSSFIQSLGRTIPSKVAISTVDYNNLGVSIRGLVLGSPEQASSLVSMYEKQLKSDEEISKIFDSIALTSLARDSENGRLSFEISMRVSAPAKNAKKL
jgi:hypothetical protein